MLNSSKIIQQLKQEQKLHPESRLLDFYKLFFQGNFGPGHYITNLVEAKNQLYRELSSAASFEKHLYQRIEYHNIFYRVNLSILKQNYAGFEDFAMGFIRSCKTKSDLTDNQWLSEWNYIVNILAKSSLKIPDFNEDSAMLNNILKKSILVSHSQFYRDSYGPHYRLFDQEQFEKLQIIRKV